MTPDQQKTIITILICISTCVNILGVILLNMHLMVEPVNMYEDEIIANNFVGKPYNTLDSRPSLGFYISFSDSDVRGESGISYLSTKLSGIFQENKIPLSSFIVNGEWDYKKLEDNISSVCVNSGVHVKWFRDQPDLPELDINKMPTVHQLMKDL